LNPRARGGLSGFGAALALALAPGEARAVENEHHLALGTGLSILQVDRKSTHSMGPGVSLQYAYQVTDAFCFMGEFASSVVAKDEAGGPDVPHTRPTGVDSLGIGPGYVLDITQKWFVYGGGLLSGWALTGGTLDKPVYAFGGQLAVGVDYMLTPHFALGFAFRQQVLLTRMDTYPTYYSGFFRAAIVWGR